MAISRKALGKAAKDMNDVLGLDPEIGGSKDEDKGLKKMTDEELEAAIRREAEELTEEEKEKREVDSDDDENLDKKTWDVIEELSEGDSEEEEEEEKEEEPEETEEDVDESEEDEEPEEEKKVKKEKKADKKKKAKKEEKKAPAKKAKKKKGTSQNELFLASLRKKPKTMAQIKTEKWNEKGGTFYNFFKSLVEDGKAKKDKKGVMSLKKGV